jgi:hypothetical protein
MILKDVSELTSAVKEQIVNHDCAREMIGVILQEKRGVPNEDADVSGREDRADSPSDSGRDSWRYCHLRIVIAL